MEREELWDLWYCADLDGLGEPMPMRARPSNRTPVHLPQPVGPENPIVTSDRPRDEGEEAAVPAHSLWFGLAGTGTLAVSNEGTRGSNAVDALVARGRP